MIIIKNMRVHCTFLLFLFFHRTISAIENVSDVYPCEYNMSFNITGGVQYPNGSVFAEDNLFPSESVYKYVEKDNSTSIRGCLCHLKPCMRKCCPKGNIYANKNCVQSDIEELHPFRPDVYSKYEKTSIKSDEYFMVLLDPKCEQIYRLYPEEDEMDNFYLQKNGELLKDDGLVHNIHEYCLDYFMDENDTISYSAIICFDAEEQAITEQKNTIILILNAIGMLISIPLLIITFLIYAIEPELRNLHGKALMGYVSALIVAFSCLVGTQIYTKTNEYQEEKPVCVTIAFFMYFSFMVSFFWLNVMSIDIWWTFRGMKAASGRRSAEKRRFILYGLYAWGIPLLMTGFCIWMHFGNLPDYIIKPQMGKESCWFHGNKATFLYFYLPMIILTLGNIVLFSITAYRILKIKKETKVLTKGDSRRHSQYEKDKQRFVLYIKLFLVMGLTWSAESISFVIGGSNYYWILTDFINAIQGILVFFIFVCKPKIKKLLIKRYRKIRYGSTVTRTRDSSRYRSGNTNSSSIGENTEKSFLSDDNAIKLSSIKYR